MRNLSPLRLVQIALSSSLLVATAYPLNHLSVPLQEGDHLGLFAFLWANIGRITLVFAPLLVGGMIDLWAELSIGRALTRNRWSDSEIETAQHWIGRRAFVVLQFGMLFGYLGAMIFALMTHKHVGGLVVLVYPALALSRMQIKFRPATHTQTARVWTQSLPIQSEHWGEPSKADIV